VIKFHALKLVEGKLLIESQAVITELPLSVRSEDRSLSTLDVTRFLATAALNVALGGATCSLV
jgi:hypothetical protein